MARQRGIIKLQGTIGGLSFIKSKTYGDHARAARGTYKEAQINNVLKGNSEKPKIIGRIGSPVLKQLKVLEPGFHSGDLWSRMMGCMLKAKSMKVADLLESLTGIEINERYAFAKLFTVLPRLELHKRKGRLDIDLEVVCHPQFQRALKGSEYLCEVSVLFFDGKNVWTVDSMETDWISFDEGKGIYEMNFAVPKGAKFFLAIAGVKGGRYGKAIESFAARGYCIKAWGKC